MCFFCNCTRETTSLGLKMKRRNNNQFFSGLRMDNLGARNEFIALSRVLNETHRIKHEHSMASQDFKNENGNAQ